MPAWEPTIAAGTAVATNVLCRKFIPAVSKDPRIDAAIRAAGGLALLLMSAKVGNGMAKGAVIGAGVGLITCGIQQAVPALA